MRGIEYDEDAEMHYVRVSEVSDDIFRDMVRTHKELFDEPPNNADWIYIFDGDMPISSVGVSTGYIPDILTLVADIWDRGAVDVFQLMRFVEDLEFEPAPEEDVPPDFLE